MLKLLQYCNYIIIVMQIKLMLLLLLLHWKRKCEMLIGRDDISSDINTLNWHMFFNVCLHAFVLISALRWLVEIWQLSKWGDIGELEVEFKFQRRSCKLSFSFLPCNQSTPESLHSGYRSLCKSELCAVSLSFLKWQVPRHLKVGLQQFRFTSLFNQHLGVLVSVPE